MTEREKQRFQRTMIIVNISCSLLISIGMAAWGYSRSDSKEMQAKVDQKVEKSEFKDYKQEVSTRIKDVEVSNNDKWDNMDKKVTAIYDYLLKKDKK